MKTKQPRALPRPLLTEGDCDAFQLAFIAAYLSGQPRSKAVLSAARAASRAGMPRVRIEDRWAELQLLGVVTNPLPKELDND